MVRLGEALFSYLTNNSGVSALVGDRVFPVIVPQDVARPAIAYFKVSDPPGRTFGRRFFARPRYQFNCWGTSYETARAAGDAVKAALENYAGMMGGDNGVKVRMTYFEGDLDLYDDPTGQFVTAIEYSIEHVEPTP